MEDWCGAGGWCSARASPAAAADKAHQQLMAEIRMLQEQQQQLQQMMGGAGRHTENGHRPRSTIRRDEPEGVRRSEGANRQRRRRGPGPAREGGRHQRPVVDCPQELEAVRQAMSSMPATRRGAHAGARTAAGRRAGGAADDRRQPPAGADRLGAVHFSAADVRQRVQRLHGGPVRHRDPGIQCIH